MVCPLNISSDILDTCKKRCNGNDGYLTLLLKQEILPQTAKS